MKMCQGTFLKQGAGFELFFTVGSRTALVNCRVHFVWPTFQDIFSPVLTYHKMADGIEMKHQGGMSIYKCVCLCVVVCSEHSTWLCACM